jgi:hypothetical protein
MMELGGNQRFLDFLREHGISEDMPIRRKYKTRAVEWYRRNLRAEAEGTEAPEPLPIGTGHLPMEEEDASDGTNQILDAVFADAPLLKSSTPPSPGAGQVRERSKNRRRSQLDVGGASSACELKATSSSTKMGQPSPSSKVHSLCDAAKKFMTKVCSAEPDLRIFADVAVSFA